MRLVLLGTTGYHPNDRRQTACFLFPETGLMLDAGTGIYRAREYFASPSLDIFLTHCHLDHVFGLTVLFDVMWKTELEYVRVHAQPEWVETLNNHLFSKAIFPIRPPFDWTTLASQFETADGGILTHCPLKHPGGSTAYRIDWPTASIAYVTDTIAEANADYVDFIKGVDLLVHECYFPDGWEDRAELTGHSCATPVAQVAKKAKVGKLVLVHINPLDVSDDPVGLAGMRKIYRNIEIGEDRQAIEFGK
jgi:ribonuclease Z